MFGKKKDVDSPQYEPQEWGGTPDLSGEIVARMAALEDAHNRTIAELTASLEEKDRTLMAMNDAVASSRRDQVAVLLTPTAGKLIDLQQQVRHASMVQREEKGNLEASEELHFFANRITDALETLGFGEIDCEPGAPFDARRHEAVRTAGTEHRELDRTVGGVLRAGYAFAGSSRVAFPAKVIVNEYVYGSGAN